MSRRWLALLLPWLVLLPLSLAGRGLQAAPEANFIVNSFQDAPDANLGDGQCLSTLGPGTCTLRAAVQQASSNANPDAIQLPAGTFTLSRSGASEDAGLNGDLDLTGTLTLTGAGPASTIIDGDGNQTGDRVLDVHAGSVTISGLTVRNGRANLQGGGVNNRAGATLVLAETAVSGNVAAVVGGLFGGGIYSEGGLTLFNSTVTSNTNGPANAVGGGITFVGLNQTLVLSNTTISANSTADLGGGLYAGAAIVTITHSTLDNNQALYGGGLYAYDSQVALVNSTLSGNSSRHSGGGLFNHTGSTALFNVTITNNTADSDANGAGGGGGFALSGGLISGRSSLIAGNYQLDPFGGGGVIQVDDDCLGAFTSLDVNLLVAPANGGCAVTGARLSTFPALGPLADNGGPTRTHALLAGSAALDAGPATGCLGWDGQPLARDQRGTPRPLFGGSALACDLGAFEYVGPVFMPFLQR